MITQLSGLKELDFDNIRYLAHYQYLRLVPLLDEVFQELNDPIQLELEKGVLSIELSHLADRLYEVAKSFEDTDLEDYQDIFLSARYAVLSMMEPKIGTITYCMDYFFSHIERWLYTFEVSSEILTIGKDELTQKFSSIHTSPIYVGELNYLNEIISCLNLVPKILPNYDVPKSHSAIVYSFSDVESV